MNTTSPERSCYHSTQYDAVVRTAERLAYERGRIPMTFNWLWGRIRNFNLGFRASL